MAALAPPVAAIRLAVRHALTRLPPGGPVLVACSGGADSLALAAAVAFVAPRLGRSAGLVTVDHRLQPGSADQAAAVVRWARSAGLAPVESVSVDVTGRAGGPEAAARDARYEALTALARAWSAPAVLLGHTRDDQAETVLLALARGAGPRGIAGMPTTRHRDGVLLLRPLLDIGREETRAACAALGLDPWHDPQNADPSYARARIRGEVLPVLVRALGPAVVENLARTARLVASDNAALDDLAAAALVSARAGGADTTPVADTAPVAEATSNAGVGLDAGVVSNAGVVPNGDVVPEVGAGADRPGGDPLAVDVLAALAPAVRTRALHRWARDQGAIPAALSHRHVSALDALVTDWHGQGPVHLPGAVLVHRRAGRLRAG